MVHVKRSQVLQKEPLCICDRTVNPTTWTQCSDAEYCGASEDILSATDPFLMQLLNFCLPYPLRHGRHRYLCGTVLPHNRATVYSCRILRCIRRDHKCYRQCPYPLSKSYRLPRPGMKKYCGGMRTEPTALNPKASAVRRRGKSMWRWKNSAHVHSKSLSLAM